MRFEVSELWEVLREDFRAWRRGDRRVAPRFDVNGRITRGRVYARNDEAVPGLIRGKSRLKAFMSFRVYRAATDTWEDPVDAGKVDVEVK